MNSPCRNGEIAVSLFDPGTADGGPRYNRHGRAVDIPGPARDPDATYSVYAWDHDDGDWEPVARGLRQFAIRGPVNDLLRSGYDPDLSILVERDDP